VLVAEKFRAMVAASDLRLPGHLVASPSQSAPRVQADDTAQTLLKRADQALYEQAPGRNRVCVG